MNGTFNRTTPGSESKFFQNPGPAQNLVVGKSVVCLRMKAVSLLDSVKYLINLWANQISLLHVHRWYGTVPKYYELSDLIPLVSHLFAQCWAAQLRALSPLDSLPHTRTGLRHGSQHELYGGYQQAELHVVGQKVVNFHLESRQSLALGNRSPRREYPRCHPPKLTGPVVWR